MRSTFTYKHWNADMLFGATPNEQLWLFWLPLFTSAGLFISMFYRHPTNFGVGCAAAFLVVYGLTAVAFLSGQPGLSLLMLLFLPWSFVVSLVIAVMSAKSGSAKQPLNAENSQPLKTDSLVEIARLLRERKDRF